MTFLFMSCHWNQHHVMPMASSIVPLHFLNQENQNEVQHDFSGHVMHSVLTLASCDAVGIVNGKTAFLCSR